jgi:hypothetical protein
MTPHQDSDAPAQQFTHADVDKAFIQAKKMDEEYPLIDIQQMISEFMLKGPIELARDSGDIISTARDREIPPETTMKQCLAAIVWIIKQRNSNDFSRTSFEEIGRGFRAALRLENRRNRR